MADVHQDVPTRDQIRTRAYELYIQRGGENGRDVDDWLAAERELRNQHSSTGGKLSIQESSGSQKQQKARTFAAGSNLKGI